MEANQISPDDIRRERLRRERDYYLSEEGYLDFIRDSGACPDAQKEPHGRYAQDIIHWNGEPDPENKEQIIYKYKMVLWPRGSFKTQGFDIGYVAWLIARNPDIRILVTSETDNLSSDIVEKVKDIIDSEWYRERFGVHRGKKWKTGEFTSGLLSKERSAKKEPTLKAGSVGTVETGMHWDVVVMDDVCSQKNTQTPEAIEVTQTITKQQTHQLQFQRWFFD